eukprot:Em0002g1762a
MSLEVTDIWWKLYLILLSLLETRKRQQEEEGHTPDGFDAVSVQNVGSTYTIVSWDLPTHIRYVLDRSSSHAHRHCTPVGTWCWASSVHQPAQSKESEVDDSDVDVQLGSFVALGLDEFKEELPQIAKVLAIDDDSITLEWWVGIYNWQMGSMVS